MSRWDELRTLVRWRVLGVKGNVLQEVLQRCGGDVSDRDCGRVAIPPGRVGRREDFNAGGIEIVLDALVEFGIRCRHEFGLACVSVDLIGDVDVIRARLEYEGGWVFEDVLSSQCRLDEQHMHLPPRHIVSDGHFGIQDQAPILRG